MKIVCRMLGLGVIVVATGCGGPGSVNGTIDGTTINVQSAIFGEHMNSDGTVANISIVLSDTPNACAVVKANQYRANATGAVIVAAREDQSGGFVPPTAGKYAIVETGQNITPPGNFAGINFFRSDSNCNDRMPSDYAVARDGLLTIDKLELGSSVTGTFNVVVGPDQAKVTGSFTATYCEAPTGQGAPTCQ